MGPVPAVSPRMIVRFSERIKLAIIIFTWPHYLIHIAVSQAQDVICLVATLKNARLDNGPTCINLLTILRKLKRNSILLKPRSFLLRRVSLEENWHLNKDL